MAILFNNNSGFNINITLDNVKTKLGIKIINDTATGNTYNQLSSISWSYRNLGKVALNHTKKKQKIHVLTPNTIDGMFIIKSFKLKISFIIWGKL